MISYYARVCFNSKGWVFPTGEAKKLEKDTWVAEGGFGLEEWLFNFAWLMDGYHYAFLQPVHRSFKNVSGETINLMLYTINPAGDRVYVGEIRRCQVLTKSQARAALKHYRRTGWLKSMKESVRSSGGDIDIEEAFEDLFNIRFLPADTKLYDPPRIAGPRDSVQKLNRYSLVRADARVVRSQWRRRKGTRIPPTVQTITRTGQHGVTYDPIEKALQGELLSLLQREYGRRAVVLEENHVDITIRDGRRKILVEIKSDSHARIAIRNALGQILEYAYFHAGPKHPPFDLVIVAPGIATADVLKYIAGLRSTFGIPLSYCAFSLGSTLPRSLERRTP